MRVNIDLTALKKKKKSYAIVKQNYDFFFIYSSSHSRRARDKKEGEWAQFLEINPKEPE